jgi:ketosteroid isomerase-like protein
MTDIERRNIERVKHWEQTWNTKVDRMVDECYAEDCVAINMMTGYTMRGREALRAIEHKMLAFDGTRRMEITKMLASGDSVAVEADVIWGSKRTKGCAFLTFNSDGMIVRDQSYGSDPSGASSH